MEMVGGPSISLLTCALLLTIAPMARADILRYVNDTGQMPEPAPADAKWVKLKPAPDGGRQMVLDARTVEDVSYAVATYGYGLNIRFSLQGIKELQDAPKEAQVIWVVSGKELLRQAPGSHRLPREIFWVRSLGHEELKLDDAKQLVEAIKGSNTGGTGAATATSPATAPPTGVSGSAAAPSAVPDEPNTATSQPEALNGFKQSTRTLSPAFLDRLKENESICWGRMDESMYYGVIDAQNDAVTKEAATFAAANGMPLWRCTSKIPLVLGKVEFITKPENRRARLVFVETESRKRHEIQLLSGVGNDSLFYIVLPRGTYRLEVNQRWGDNNPQFNASAGKDLMVPGGRSAVHIGHLRMGVDKNPRGQPGLVLMLFDTANAEAAQAWFKGAHPSFRGEVTTQRLVQQPVVVDEKGELYYWHRDKKR